VQLTPVSGIAICLIGCGRDEDGYPTNVQSRGFAGEALMEHELKKAIKNLDGELDQSIAAWQSPEQDQSLDASYVCYNMATDPNGYDFIVWLIAMEMRRVRLGAPAPLKVGFWTEFGKHRTPTDTLSMWLNNVFRPALPMIGAVEDPAACRGRGTRHFTPRVIVEAAEEGEKVPLLRSVIQSNQHPGSVTITLRESGKWPQRNSDLVAWGLFAEYLDRHGEHVVIVRDTAKADEPFGDFTTSPQASRDLDFRMALYENAKLNCFVSNGPATLAVHSKAPWMMFIPVEDQGSTYYANTPEFWDRYVGIEMGVGQYPWSGPNQRIIWKKDRFENIVAAYRESE
jgi:hypothetical protein